MKFQWILIFFMKILPTITLQFKKYPYADMTFEQKIAFDGYPLESYKTTTADNYILTIYRIPWGRKNVQKTTRSPVLLLHGLGATPDMFVLQGANKSLAYNLADGGFDVWLLNARGVIKSRGHKYYNINKGKKYWNFGFHEVAVYDVTANIDFILTKTKQKPFVIGHSQGNTCYFIMMAEKPEYNEKVKLGVAYGPGIKFDIDNPFIPPLLYITGLLKAIYDLFGFYELIPNPSLLTTARDLCKEQTYFLELCFQVINIIGTHESKLINMDLTPAIIGAAARARISVYQILHYVQIIKTGRFGQYNYGPTINMKIYGNITPPLYNLKQITSPVILFYAQKDELGTIKLADDTIKELPNVYLYEKVQFENFNHIDFLFGRNATKLVYQKTIKMFHDYDYKLKSKIDAE
ncbi:unnamed protein product, partial [Psylliodes chrysocephalus]